MNWRAQAACIEAGPENFYPGQQRSKRVAKITKRAKAFCAKCPVVEECLEHSLLYEPYGIWGGLDEAERELLREERGMPILLTTRERLWER